MTKYFFNLKSSDWLEKINAPCLRTNIFWWDTVMAKIRFDAIPICPHFFKEGQLDIELPDLPVLLVFGPD